MIFGNLKSWDQESSMYPDILQNAIKFLQENDFTTMEAKKYEIDGDKLFAMVMDKETSPKEERAPEAHVDYVDIQFLVSGKEIIGFAKKTDGLVVKEDKLKEKDIIKYTNEVPNEMELKLFPGDFAVFFPEDIHRPLCAFDTPGKVRKVVVKVKVSELCK
ncbi:YhcH/YjgK/YiaL family protein [Defluviitalea phaphyphila]|uniref:YhcH/YjgK/YiaL family protein n=1 Tax=Defluviitalea phaphyphila TaxID=1473580 RepID=UPI000730CE24|nr:YhcH/YjgK/YiaL family protein [Defluviitalea phaphyphila]